MEEKKQSKQKKKGKGSDEDPALAAGEGSLGGKGGRPRTVVTRQEKIDIYIIRHIPKAGPASSAAGVSSEKYKATLAPPDEKKDPLVKKVTCLKDQLLQYSFPTEWQDDRKKVQEKRDLALSQLKKKCLRTFHEENPDLRTTSAPVAKKKVEGIASKSSKSPAPDANLVKTESQESKKEENKETPAPEQKKNFELPTKPSASGLAVWRRQCLYEAHPPSLADAANLLFGVEKEKPAKIPPLPRNNSESGKKRSFGGGVKRSAPDYSVELPAPPSPKTFGQVFWCDDPEASNEQETPKTPNRKVSGGAASELQAASVGAGGASVTPPEDIWVACDKCTKWRRLPADTDPEDLPQRWFCRMNPDRNRADCSVPEEAYVDKVELLPDPLDQMKRRRTGLWVMRQKCRKRFETRFKQNNEDGEINHHPNKPNKFNWIRCCNPSCRRWRALNNIIPLDPTAIMDPNTHLEMEWYCWMNSWDETVASCAAPEEIGYDHCIQNFVNEDLELPAALEEESS